MSFKTYSAIWKRILRPERNNLRPELAKEILKLKFPRGDVDRMNELAAKAREGSLTKAEQLELEEYEDVGFALSLMQAKARAALKQRVPAA
ncbi:MAG TPA: hypothetical protein VGQ99_23090 [Tepidisphaeraceae bacterium]|jgi:hypothetical protein|nr:hypothetical protein [Tepidisphaeraceae bacterium]